MNSYRDTHQNVGPRLLVGTGEVHLWSEGLQGGPRVIHVTHVLTSRTDCSNILYIGKANRR